MTSPAPQLARPPRRARLRLRGPRERDIQPWILASLGVEQKRPAVTKSGKWRMVSTGFYLTADSMFWRNNTGAFINAAGHLIRFGAKGSADIVGIVRGTLVCFEVKRDHSEKQTPEQREFQAWVVARGGVYAVVTSPAEALAVVERVRREAA